MSVKGFFVTIISILLIGAFGFVLTWGIINFNKVKQGLSGTGLYTAEDLENAKKDGYNEALTNKEEYDVLISQYRDTITELNDDISQLNSQVTILTNNNKNYQQQLDNLQKLKKENEETISSLTIINNQNSETIQTLNSQINNLKEQVNTLTLSGNSKSEQISQLNNQIDSLQNLVSQLQATNDLNLKTIQGLNNQITALNNQILEMSEQIQNNSSNVSVLNSRISELEKSVAYYEQYIANLENGEQIVITFEFNGSVYNIQIIDKNSTITVNNPTSTDYVIFNYWTVNSEKIDLETYNFSTNTKVVANVTYKYDVKFMVDNGVHNSQIIEKDCFASVPLVPTKDGYEFDGWTLNGIDIVSVDTYKITENTTFVAKFTKLHTVTFMYEQEVKYTQKVRNGSYATNVEVDNTKYKVFNGWTLNGVIVDLSSKPIVADTIFVASISYYFDVTFMNEYKVHNQQLVESGKYASVPLDPTKDGFVFDGWTLNGTDIIDVKNYEITQTTTFIAHYSVSSWVEKTWNGLDNVANFKGSDVWTDGANIYYSRNGYNFVLNKETSTWQTKIWKGKSSFSGADIINCSNNVFLVCDDPYDDDGYYKCLYKLNKELSTFEYYCSCPTTGDGIWTDSENVYWSIGTSHYVLDTSSAHWEKKIWNGLTDFGNIGRPNIWTDGFDTYISISGGLFGPTYQYKLNKESSTWEQVIFDGIDSFSGSDVWTAGGKVYLYVNSWGSVSQYELNVETHTWSSIDWNDIVDFDVSKIWTDGKNTYYSNEYVFGGSL